MYVLIVSLVVCLTAFGCAPKKEKEGGVDGSGGLLPHFMDESFRDWVEKGHPFYVRDLVYRLLILQKKSPADLDYDDLAERFLGKDEAELWQLVESISYFTVEGACPAKDPNSDSSVDLKTKRICFSYLAFKNLPFSHMESKLLAMTMHEIGHLRGFSELEATKWQLRFDGGNLGKQTILSFNDNHRNVVLSLQKAMNLIGTGMDALLGREEGTKKYACAKLYQADERVSDLYFSGQFIASYLQKRVHDEIQLVISDLRDDCSSKSEGDLALQFEMLLLSFDSIQRELEIYESPLCGGELCVFRRSAAPAGNYLARWNFKKKDFLAKKPYPVIEENKVTCTLLDLTNNKEVPLSEDGYTSWPRGTLDPLWHLFIGERFGGDVEVELEHNGYIEMLETKGFSASHFWMRAPMSKESHSTVRFAVLDPHLEKYRKLPGESELLAPTYEMTYTSADPYFWFIKRKPTRIQEYILDCWVK